MSIYIYEVIFLIFLFVIDLVVFVISKSYIDGKKRPDLSDFSACIFASLGYNQRVFIL
ncbi:hypothetical protein THOD04_160052 [Vibrio owensii]|nr:hypothetical protein THOD04_160052 [Vibrio owensii]